MMNAGKWWKSGLKYIHRNKLHNEVHKMAKYIATIEIFENDEYLDVKVDVRYTYQHAEPDVGLMTGGYLIESITRLDTHHDIDITEELETMLLEEIENATSQFID